MLTYIMNYKLKYQKYKAKYLALRNELYVNQSGGSNKPELYLFKAEWCGHCKNFISDWEKLKEDPKLKNKINFITMDSEIDKKIINEWDIKGFPTIILKKGTNAIEYNGNRSINNIQTFINKNIN